MIAYIAQEKNPDNQNLPPECPWVSWFYNDGDPLPDNAILVTDEEFAALKVIYDPLILNEKDKVTMAKRAEVRDTLIGEIAADNKARLRSGLWTTAQLISLTQDAEFKAAMDDILGLSFELAQSKVMAMTNPLVTMDIKMQIIGKLQEHLYL
jgi:hypothetical protein